LVGSDEHVRFWSQQLFFCGAKSVGNNPLISLTSHLYKEFDIPTAALAVSFKNKMANYAQVIITNS